MARAAVAGRGSFVIVNNSEETFTPTASGAIATHIWETAQAARSLGADVTIISRSAEQPSYAWPELHLVKAPSRPTRIDRAVRRALRTRHALLHRYARQVIGATRGPRRTASAVIVHNDPELAVLLAVFLLRGPTIVHLFHNELAVARPYRWLMPRLGIRSMAVSDYIRSVVSQALGVPCGAIAVALNGVDAQRFRPKALGDPETAPPLIGFVGRLGREKGAHVLLQAALELRARGCAFRLQILGSNTWGAGWHDDYQKELQGLIRRLMDGGVDVSAPGHIVREDLPDLLRQVDIHCVPSLWQEPCALSLFEGMASGAAVVASDSGGSAQVLGGTGRLFQVGDASALADALQVLLDDAVLLRATKDACRARAATLTWAKTWTAIHVTATR